MDDGLAKFYGLSICRVVDSSNTSLMFAECILVNTNTYNNGNYKYINNNDSYKYINNNGNGNGKILLRTISNQLQISL